MRKELSRLKEVRAKLEEKLSKTKERLKNNNESSPYDGEFKTYLEEKLGKTKLQIDSVQRLLEGESNVPENNLIVTRKIEGYGESFGEEGGMIIPRGQFTFCLCLNDKQDPNLVILR